MFLFIIKVSKSRPEEHAGHILIEKELNIIKNKRNKKENHNTLEVDNKTTTKIK